MSQGLVEAIPWHFTDEPGVLLWTWTAPHFVARIRGQEVAGPDSDPDRRLVRSFQWDLADLVHRHQGLPRMLVEGAAASFDEAEDYVREHVGKAYDPSLGYRRYAGALAYTFTLSTGERIDVRPFIGTPCVVTVLLPDRTHQTVAGDFSVHHYQWRLTTSSHEIDIIPDHVVSLTNRSAAADRAAEVTRLSTYTGIGRIYREDPRPGCTGRPGFEVGTVDHAGSPRCPLHEEGLPEHLLH